MPSISFCFSGYVNGANIEKARNRDGQEVDVSGMSAEELAYKLRHGVLNISPLDYFSNSRKSELSAFAFDADIPKES